MLVCRSMAGGVNKVILVGNLGSDPEVRSIPSGAAVCEFRLATNETWMGKDGQKQDRTEWHRVVVWGKRAETCGKYLSKGRQVYLEGRIRTRSWEDKEGNKRYTTEIVANDVQFLGGGGGGRSDDGPPPSGDSDFGFNGGGGGSAGPDDDIPF